MNHSAPSASSAQSIWKRCQVSGVSTADPRLDDHHTVRLRPRLTGGLRRRAHLGETEPTHPTHEPGPPTQTDADEQGDEVPQGQTDPAGTCAVISSIGTR